MKSKFTLHYLALVAVLLLNIQTFAQKPHLTFTTVVNSGLVQPVYITNCKDDRLFIVEQQGRIRIKHPGVAALDTFMDINSLVGGGSGIGTETGLLSVAFHPDYKQNGYFYVDYTNNNFNTTIARFTVNPADSNKALVSSQVILLTIWQPYSNHNGGQLQFGSDGYLYIGMGDGGSANDPGNRAHNKDSLLGKILRIDVNNGLPYTIPLDNPFINAPNGVARHEVYTYGMRNPWRFSFDRLTGDLWIGDVGQGAWEEIDFLAKGTGAGEDFGWRCWEGTHVAGNSGCSGIVNQHPPIYEYAHGNYCSVTGGFIYRGAQYANLFGNYLFVDYCFSTIQSLKDSAGTIIHYNDTTFNGGGSDIVSFGEDMYGELYCAELTAGKIYKIGEVTDCPVAYIAATDTLMVCDSVKMLITPLGQNLIYHWTDGSGAAIGATNTLSVSQSGWYHVDVVNAALCSNTDSVYVNLLGPPPAASFTGLDSFYCVYSSADTLIGTPAGGAFIGSGVNNATFNPNTSGLGVHIIHYNYTDANGCVSAANAVVHVDACVGLTEINGVSAGNVYPNPTKEQLQINLDALKDQKASALITDIAGRNIQQKELLLNAGKNTVTMNIENMDTGIYLFVLTIEGASLSRKFVVAE